VIIQVQFQGRDFYGQRDMDASLVPRENDFLSIGERSFRVRHVVWMYSVDVGALPIVRVLLR
jgi:hypothetical protein